MNIFHGDGEERQPAATPVRPVADAVDNSEQANGGALDATVRLANEIRQRRNRAGMSQPELARLIGYTRQYVSHAERPQANLPSLELVRALDKTLKADGLLLELREAARQERHGRRDKTTPPDTSGNTGPILEGRFDDVHPPQHVRTSQEEWLRVRNAPGVRGRELTELAAWLYPESDRAVGGHVLADSHWLLEEPVELDSVKLCWDQDAAPYALPEAVPIDGLLPLRDEDNRYADYSRAVRDLVRPRLLENRLSYRLTGVHGEADGTLTLRFGRTTFFEVFNVKQMVAHEFKKAWLLSGRQIPGFERLPLRAAIGNPFDPARLLMSPGINTLTIRRGSPGEGASFVLHERDGGKVADGGGLCHVMPAGEFQPSSSAPVDVANDFSLWRNIMREFSEEFLGNPEHDGCNPKSIDYENDEPFVRFELARDRGTLRMWHYGLVVEPLELGALQLTVAVLDAPEFDRLFANMVSTNDEGSVIGKGGTKRIPFTEEAINRLEPRLTASALTLLRLAWRDRAALLRY
ncbi:helix-turn-helix transcriptional regulator [Saccharothrix xinjiangensis]|uniref:Helix-turn-helix transcriptional regulator n=1 Tax=Saccharothrix xinjiangensis TaxID=204798 RepID=A0ABV9YE72_9PSEU